MARGRRKRERYVDRWKREHRRVEFWLTKEEYALLERAMNKRGRAVKEVVLEALKCLDMEFKPGFDEGYEQALKDFVDKPHFFYEKVKKLVTGHVALFTMLCPLCGEAIVFTHKSDN